MGRYSFGVLVFVQMVKKMIKRYIESEETIILNVLTCMVDAETCESLKMSKEHDPERKRTLLVFTHVDRNEVDSTLVNKYHQCQNDHGFDENRIFFVRNRTMTENQSKTDLAQVQQNEMKFFESKKNGYHGILSSCLGSQQLTKTLVEIQKEKILETLPSIKEKLTQKILQLDSELDSLPNMIENENEAMLQLCDVIGKLFDSLIHARDGMVNTLVGESVSNKNSMGKNGDDDRYADDGYGDEDEYICSQTLSMYESFEDKIRLIRKPKDFISEESLDELRRLNHQSRGFPALPGITLCFV